LKSTALTEIYPTSNLLTFISSLKTQRTSFNKQDLSMRASLLDILESKETAKKFKEYLRAKNCDANLYFWIDCETFANPNYTPEHQLESRAAAIYCKYFSDNPKYKLALSSNMTLDLYVKIQAGGTNRDLFKDAQNLVFKLMEVTCVSDFLEEFCHQKASEKKKEASLKVKTLHRIKASKDNVQMSVDTLNLETFYMMKCLGDLSDI
jgi:hypothetical protein